MKLADIKTQLGIGQFNLNSATDKDDVKDPNWMRHWDNDQRISVSIHRDTLADIKANPDSEALDLQTEVKTGPKGEYTSHRIIMYRAEETL